MYVHVCGYVCVCVYVGLCTTQCMYNYISGKLLLEGVMIINDECCT